jgi:undecaprenyl-diphosphatase
MNVVQAVILGVVEGLTEFLPVSSTGHLILVSHAMGLVGSAVDAFEIVIQAGALLAVVWLYRARLAEILGGIFGGDPKGRALLLKLFVAFLPAAAIGLVAHHWVEEHLFGPRPVAIALILGGILMIWIARGRTERNARATVQNVDDLPLMAALWIGVAQCLSLWPGTSRSMVTILAALLLGATPVVAAEFSFLLALPTLGAATLFDLAKHHHELLGPDVGGPLILLTGLIVSAIVAVIAIRGFLKYLTSRGLAPFGWYRIAIGALVIVLLWKSGGGAP